ncbi:MAG: recombinase family protein, partial [Rhizobiales bacterium]|nr:recombinase family protein [Hyphomicrobiales bacterium]
MNRVAIYARYSSDQQSETSIEDQIRLCREYAEREGWTITECYKDMAISGASLLLRPGVQMLMQDAMKGAFDIILAEALDRLSRDQADIANLYKQLQFQGVQLTTLSEGKVSELHVGLKGTMNALFLKDLANKTRRGLRGRVEKGKSGGGNCFGYDVVRKFTSDGSPIKGDRKINKKEADIVRRIFTEYAHGKSPKAIALQLNKEGVPGPTGKGWGPSTINGNRDRGTGILNNELYIGRLIWNRLRYIKNPNTGKRVSRLNPETEWIVKEVPDMQIVEQELWDQAKARQGSLDTIKAYNSDNALTRKRRPKYLFSGLTKCACCGGGYSKISKDLLGCYSAKNKGTCTNNQNIRQDELENRILKAIRHNLMDPQLFEEFCKEYTRFMNKMRIEHNAELQARQNEFERIDKELKKLVDALCQGVPAKEVKDQMIELSTRKKELDVMIKSNTKPVTLLHPNMALTYQAKLDELFTALTNDATKDSASEAIRSLIDTVILSP